MTGLPPSRPNRRRLRRVAAALASVLALAVPARAASSEREPQLVVPGGKRAVARLIGFDVEAPDFTGSLNRAFLRLVRTDGLWNEHPVRGRLALYLDVLADLGRQFPDGLRFEGADALRGSFARLAGSLGYSIAFEPGGAILVPLAGDEAIGRRDVGRALGWELSTSALDLWHGGTVELTLGSDRVRPPLPWERWRDLNGGPVPPESALGLWVRDQRVALIAAGLERVSGETARVLDEEPLRSWLHTEGATAFFRHAAVLDVVEGRVRMPGGEAAAPVWSSILGVSPADPAPFLYQLLALEGGRVAYLWEALADAPPALTAILLGGPDTASGRPAWIAELDALGAGAAFGGPRAESSGLRAAFRVVPVEASNGTLALPGGNGPWLAALQATEIATQDKQLKRALREAASPPSDFELLRTLWARSPLVDGRPAPSWRRFERLVRFFERHAAAFSPEALVVVAPAADRFPGALDACDGVRLDDAQVLIDYVRTVHHLDELETYEARHLLVAVFQSGVELLVALARSDALDPARQAAAFRDWVRLHLAADDPLALAGPELDWLAALVEALPPAGPEVEARGPLEAALLGGLTRRRDPQGFTWEGLELRGARAGDLVRRMAAILEGQRVPAVDPVLRIRRGLVEIRSARKGPSVGWVHEEAEAMESAFRALPPPELPNVRLSDRLRPMFESVHRGEADDVTRSFAGLDSFNSFPRFVGRLTVIDRMLVADGRSTFLGPVYVRPMAELDTTLFDHAPLIRKHTITRDPEERSATVGTANPWNSVDLVVGTLSELGTHIGGDLGRIAWPLAEQHFSGRHAGGGVSLVERFRVAFAASLAMPWQRWRPELGRRVAASVDRGREAVAAAVAELRDGRAGPAVARAASVVPLARLERFALDGSQPISISEHLQLGWDGDGPTADDLPGLPRSRRGWPSYEQLERDARIDALLERESIDLRVTVVDRIGRHGLPGEVGADVMNLLLEDLAVGLDLSSRWDWPGYVDQLQTYDESSLDAWMRACLERGYYRPSGF